MVEVESGLLDVEAGDIDPRDNISAEDWDLVEIFCARDLLSKMPRVRARAKIMAKAEGVDPLALTKRGQKWVDYVFHAAPDVGVSDDDLEKMVRNILGARPDPTPQPQEQKT